MAAKPRIAIVGAGNLGMTLARALRGCGYPIDIVISRPNAASIRKAVRFAKQINCEAVSVLKAEIIAQVVWFCVPDREIARAAHLLAGKRSWKGKVALHSSGALTSDELDALRRLGASVASAHPLMTFVRDSNPSVAGVPFVIEGDASAVKRAREIVKDLGARPYPIRKADKSAYHAWGTFASPLLTVLLAVTEQVGAAAGVKGKAAKQRILPILKQTLANYEALGPDASFSGPLIRGDTETVSRHLRALRRTPAHEVYVALARASLSLLPVKNRRSLAKLVGGKT
jgi:predicted short-subunit dehydrogenase-like oxidoreductase (DUF2520 family)